MSKKKFFETKEFSDLNKTWEKKLAESGFDDIEKGDTAHIIQKQIVTVHQTKVSVGLDYYQFCNAILRDHTFHRDVDRAIFELHTEGSSDREISTWLKASVFRDYSHMQVSRIILRIKEDFRK
jgi:hypothetical protein